MSEDKKIPNCERINCFRPAKVKGFCVSHYQSEQRKFNEDTNKELTTISTLADDYLTKIAEKPETKEGALAYHKKYSEVQMFCITKQLNSGPDLVSMYLIYELYKEWTPNPLTIEVFSNQIRKLFERIVFNGEAFYMVEIEPFMELMAQNRGVFKLGRYFYVDKEKESRS